MTQTTARITKGNQHFEILVDLEEAMKLKRGEEGADITRAVITDTIFHNLKSGEKAGTTDLERVFETSNPTEVAEKIIKTGEVVKTAESMRTETEQKYKQVVDTLTKLVVSPEGRPYTPDRIMKALTEAHVQIKNKPIDTQINDILDQLAKILPVKIERKKVRLTISAQYTGKAYGMMKEYIKEENWQPNGNLEAVIEMPTALTFDFYEKLNNITHGSVLSEEIKN
jgi:ribosome maturation protein SDO1